MGKFDLLAACWAADCSAQEKLVLLCLAHHQNTLTGKCNPSQDRLAQLTGLSLRTVNNAIASLKRKGMIDARRTQSSLHYSFSICTHHVRIRHAPHAYPKKDVDSGSAPGCTSDVHRVAYHDDPYSTDSPGERADKRNR